MVETKSPLGGLAGKRILFLPAPTVPAQHSSRLHGGLMPKGFGTAPARVLARYGTAPSQQTAIAYQITKRGDLIAI